MGLGRVTKSQLILYKELGGECADQLMTETGRKILNTCLSACLELLGRRDTELSGSSDKELGRCLLYFRLNR